MVASKTLEQRVEHALRPRVLTTQALTILIRAAFVGGEYIPLKFLIDLNENAPLHIRLALYASPLPWGICLVKKD